MLKYIPSIINNISNIVYSTESYRQLGRWCHTGIPKCSQEVLLRKIDFANSDNNLCNKNPSTFITTKVALDKLAIGQDNPKLKSSSDTEKEK